MGRGSSICAVVAVLLCGWTLIPSANALPSYARQTGLPCSGCHTTPPELNNAGRLFKLLGYTDRAENKTITAAGDSRRSPLSLLEVLPLSVFLEASMTGTKAPQPGTQNWNAEFPQDISLFLAGAWASHVGSFLQVTYDPKGDHFSIDNTDIRFANKTKAVGKELDYGLTLNNNPTLEDLWNASPAWGYPFIANDSAPGPSASPIINGQLATDVAGLGGLCHVGPARICCRGPSIARTTSAIRRLQPGHAAHTTFMAWLPTGVWHSNRPGRTGSLEVGAYGMHMKSTPSAVTGPGRQLYGFLVRILNMTGQ
jgi:hypothetical protein